MSEGQEETKEEQVSSESWETSVSEGPSPEERTRLETVPKEKKIPVPSHVLEDLVRSLRQQGGTWRQIEGILHIPKSTLQRKHGHIEKGNPTPVAPVYNENNPGVGNIPKNNAFNRAPGSSPIPGVLPEIPNATPPGHILLSPEAISNIRAGLSATQQRIFDSQLMVSASAMREIHKLGNPGPYPIYPYQFPPNPYLERAMQMKEAKMFMGDSDSKEVTELRHEIARLSDKIEKRSEADTILNSLQTGIALAKQNQPQGQNLQGMLGEIKTTLDFMKSLETEKGLTPAQKAELERTKIIYENLGKALQNAVSFGIGALGGKGQQVLLNKVKNVKNQNVATFTCQGCESELSIPIPPDAPENLQVKCPKCGQVTPLEKQEVKEEEAPKTRKEDSKKEKPRTLRPRYG